MNKNQTVGCSFARFFVYLILSAVFLHRYQARRSTCIICHCFAGFHRAWGMYKPKVAEVNGES